MSRHFFRSLSDSRIITFAGRRRKNVLLLPIDFRFRCCIFAVGKVAQIDLIRKQCVAALNFSFDFQSFENRGHNVGNNIRVDLTRRKVKTGSVKVKPVALTVESKKRN